MSTITKRPPRATVHEALPGRGTPEHERAKWWRIHQAKLTQAELAGRIGLSVKQVANLEAGRETNASAWRRYRLLCAAVDRGAEAFAWL
jgi:hypothetical protein